MGEIFYSPAPLQEYLLRSTSDAVLIADQEGLIRYLNPAAATMLGITPDSILGQSALQAFGKNQPLLNLFQRSGQQSLDVRLPRQRLAQGIADTLSSGERVVLLQDVTEKRDIENRREMLIKAIAHDLRNPISAIGGFADLVGRFGDLSEPQQRYLLRIRQTSSKLSDMAKSLVDLAWIEAGMPLRHIPIHLDDLVNEAVKAVEPIAQKNRIGIAVSLQRPLPIVMGDPLRLQMVVYNLLHNAVIYSHQESSIAIHAWADEHEIYCSVADRGIGISDNELEMIFDRMYRSRDERIRDIPGGGLGLTVARTIVRRHGGDIWASSNLDEGSTFTFFLPAWHSEHSPQA